MFNLLYMKALQFSAFWQMRRLWGALTYEAARTSYRLRSRNTAKGQETRVFRDFIRSTQFSIFRAIGVGLFLHLASYLLGLRFPWLELPPDKNDTYATLLIAVASICGVFIALYYTAIATVGASIYTVVPNDIRYLLNRDRAGNVYLRFLSFLAFLCLFLVAARLFGLAPSWFVVGVITLFSGFGIFSFVILGQRAFNLFDPTKLAGTIFDDMQKYLGAACVGGYRWWDPPFQATARKNMERQLRLLKFLSDYVVTQDNLRVASYPELVARSVGFLVGYQRAKRRMPASSSWYEPRLVYRDWYRSNYNEVKVATTTGTTLSSTENRDPLWVERRVIPFLYTYVASFVAHGNLDDLRLMGSLVQDYMQALFEDGDIEHGIEVLTQLGEEIFKAIRGLPAKESAKFETSLRVLGISELLAAFPVFGIVSYREALPSFQSDKIGEFVAGINWSKKSSIYKADIPAKFLPQAEWLLPRLSFEHRVYGRYITPNWYIVDILMARESQNLAQNGIALTNKIPDLYKAWKDVAKTLPTPWPYMMILSREWEYAHKHQHFLEVFKKHCEAATAARRAASLKWKDVDFGRLEKKQKAHWRAVQIEMAACAEAYAGVARPDAYPDCVGQFMHATAESILGACFDDDLELLKKLFPAYHKACQARYMQSFDPKSITDVEDLQFEIKNAGNLICDLVDISGYAKLLSEYHKSPAMWKVVTDTWNEYFSGAEGSKHVKFVASILKFVDDPTTMSHRSILRTNWGILVRQFLRQLPTHEEYPAPGTAGLQIPDTIVEHDSPLVRFMAHEMHGTSTDGIEIFGAFYLAPHYPANYIEVPRDYSDLAEMIRRQDERHPRPPNPDGAI
jgi:hypothetical protein